MDSFEWNKIAGAVLFAALIIMGIREMANTVYAPSHDAESAYAIATNEVSPAVDELLEAPSLAQLLAAGDPALGQRTYGRCRSCHTLEQGGGNRVGPNLYNVVGAILGTREGFRYSSALLAKGGAWSYEALDAWLASPRDYIRGNKMAYAGLRKPEDRANMILYLRGFSDAPPPLPVVETPSDEEAEVETPVEESALEEAEAPVDAVPEVDIPVEESAPETEPAG